MDKETMEARIRDGYYCLAIALFTGCTVEKAIALYDDNESAWITEDIIDEMIRLREGYGLTVQQLAEVYGLSKTQMLHYLKLADLRRLGIAGCGDSAGNLVN